MICRCHIDSRGVGYVCIDVIVKLKARFKMPRRELGICQYIVVLEIP